MFCGNCGQKLADGAKFCPSCGSPVAGSAPASAPAPVPAPVYTPAPTGDSGPYSSATPGQAPQDFSYQTNSNPHVAPTPVTPRGGMPFVPIQADRSLPMWIILFIVTCGFYAYWWYYKIGNRMQTNAPRYGLQFQENGTTILMWQIVGALLCGLGPIFAMNIIIKNANAMAAAYNARMGA